jgi:hypothetical protein
VVSVVEESTGYSADALVQKVADCDRQWIVPLKAQLAKRSVADGWTYRVEVFVRSDAAQALKTKFAGRPDVLVHVLDKLGHPFDWDRPAAN